MSPLNIVIYYYRGMKKLGISSIRVFGNVMVTLIIGSQILKTFCAVFGICARKNFIQRIF